MNIDDYIAHEFHNELSIYVVLSIIFGIGWIIVLIDAINSDFKEPSNKILWILLLILVPPIGLLLYACFSQKQKSLKSAEKIMLHKPEPEDRDGWSF